MILATLPSVLALLAPRAAATAQDDVAARVQSIVSRGESADPDRVRELANLRTAEALDGLLAAYEAMHSLFMRRVVLQGLALYDDVPGLERMALQRILEAATTSSEAEMRAIAVDVLADCRNYGKAFLRMIVESAADDDVRVLALRHHAGEPRPEDMDWYRELAQGSGPLQGKSGAARAVRPVPALRSTAFEAVRGTLPVGELLTFLSDPNDVLRGLALQELHARGDPAALAIARGLLERPLTPARDRLRAASIVLSAEGARAAERLIRLATEGQAAEEFSLGVAELLARSRDPEVQAELLRCVGRGKGLALRFSLRAARALERPEVDAALVELVDHHDPDVRREALACIVARRAAAALPRLEKLLAAAKPADMPDLIAAIGALKGEDPAWLERLAGFAGSSDLAVRNGALESLGATRDPRWLPTLARALASDSWSTRLAAARSIEVLRQRQGVWLLVNQLGKETGRPASELVAMLFRLTGKPFGTNAGLWDEWWRREGHALDPIAPEDLAKVQRELEARRLREVTRSTFFGLRILSERVVFVIDVSGSMREPTLGRYIDETGEPRIERAKKELVRALEGLAPTAFFNIVVFSDGAASFAARMQEVNKTTVGTAEQFVQRLGARGGTNLYGALSLALEDTDVDSIYVLSDGEPSVGDLADPHAIRSAIARANAQRGVVLHCIAIGGSLHLLEDLAHDSGGSYIEYP
jgi:hypothetical protein